MTVERILSEFRNKAIRKPSFDDENDDVPQKSITVELQTVTGRTCVGTLEKFEPGWVLIRREGGALFYVMTAHIVVLEIY